jgi:hypothetical protein
MNVHQLPLHKRKGEKAPPRSMRGEREPGGPNLYAAKRAEIRAMLAMLERDSHRTVMENLKFIMKTKALTPQQAHEVKEEIKYRNKMAKRYTRIIGYAKENIRCAMRAVPSRDPARKRA